MALTWTFEVDWDDDGSYDSAESGRLVGAAVERGRDYLVNPAGSGLEEVSAGRASLALENGDGRYDPFNSSSPLYPNVEPGKFARLKVNDGSTTYTLFTGMITDIRPEGSERVTITLEDGIRWLAEENAPETAIYTDLYAHTAIGYLLDAAKWPAIWGRSLENGVDPIGYWWANGGTALAEIQRLAASEVGLFWVDQDGKARFRNRHANPSAVTTLSQEELDPNVRSAMPWENRRNVVEVTPYPRKLQERIAVFELFSPRFVGAGETETIWAELTEPAIDIETPVSGTDYTANSLSEGEGQDLTASFSLSLTIFASRVKVEVTNSSSSHGYLTTLLLYGKPLWVEDSATARAESSGATKRPRKLALDLAWQQVINNGPGFASVLVDFLTGVGQFPEVMATGRPALQFGLDLFDVVTADIPAKSISGNYLVGRIEHRWASGNGQLVQTRLKLEPYLPYSGYWIFPATFHTTTILGW